MSEAQWRHFRGLGDGDVARGVRAASGLDPVELPRGLAGADQATRAKVSRQGASKRWPKRKV